MPYDGRFTFVRVKYTTAPNPLPSPLFTTGATLTVTAPGADFPAFNTTLTAPAAVAGFTPPTTISRAAGYHATWTTGAGPLIWVFVVIPIGSAEDLLLCEVPDNGSYTVTSTALGLIPASATQALVALIRLDKKHITNTNGYVDVVAFDGVAGNNTATLTP